MRALIILLTILAAVVQPATGLAKPVLAVIYSGNGFGAYKPCPS